MKKKEKKKNLKKYEETIDLDVEIPKFLADLY